MKDKREVIVTQDILDSVDEIRAKGREAFIHDLAIVYCNTFGGKKVGDKVEVKEYFYRYLQDTQTVK